MSDGVFSPLVWLLRTSLGGGLLLFLVWWAMRRVGQPARRQRLAEMGIASALIVALLALLPAWLPVPGLKWPSPVVQAIVASAESVPEKSCEENDEFVSDGPLESAHINANMPADTYLMGISGSEIKVDSPTLTAAPISATLARHVPSGISPDSRISWEAVWKYTVWAYVLGASIVTCYWLMGYLGIWRLLRTAMAPPRRVRLVLNAISRHADSPRVLVSRRLRVPISFGLWRPTIVLPVSLCRPAEKERLRWALAHEWAHLRRGDAWSMLLVNLGGVIFYFCPWFWSLRRQVQLCQEYVADAAAVARDARHEEYAQFLLGMAGTPPAPALVLSVRGTPSDLFRRVSMLLQNPIRVERRCTRLWWAGTALSLLAVSVFVSGIGAAPDKPVKTDKPAVVDVDDDADNPAENDEKPANSEKNKNEIKRKKFDRKMMDFEDFSFDDLRKALENLPEGVDAERIEKEVRKALENMKGKKFELRLDNEAFPKLDKNAFRNNVNEALKGLNIDNEELQNRIKEALQNANRLGDWQLVLPMEGGLALDEQVQGGGAMRTGAAGHGRLGIMVDQPSAALREQLDLPANRGLVVSQVVADSSAAKAGLKVNDILLQLDGKPVTDNAADLLKLVDGLDAKATVDALVLRKGKKEKITGIVIPETPKSNRLRAAPRVPATGAFGGAGGRGMAGGMAGFGGGQGMVMTTVTRSNDRVNARHQEGNLVITLTGTVTDGKAKVSEIHIQDGGKAEKHDGIEDVPDRYRDKVKSLLEMCEKGNVKVDVQNRRRGRPNRDDLPPVEDIR